MANKTDVKAIMARFQANGSTSEDATSTSAVHSKQPLHPTLSGQASHMKRTVSDGLPGSGASVPPKPSFIKNAPSSNNDPLVPELNKAKSIANRFNNAQEINKPFLQNKSQSKTSFTQTSELKGQVSKPDLKPAFPKPAVTSTKPAWVKENSTTSALSSSPSAPKIPAVQVKPSNNFFKLQQQIEAKAEVTADSVGKPTPPVNAAAKPSNFKTAQNLFNKDLPEQVDNGIKPSAVNKPPQNVSSSIPPPKPPASKKPSLKKPSTRTDADDPSAPKKNPLPNSLALGPAPAKPNRPPNVNLEVFKKESETNEDKVKAKSIVPPPPPSHPNNQSNNVTPAPPAVPSLPPGHPGSKVQTEETEDFYDDVDGFTIVPPPLPPVHPSQMSKGKNESDDEEGEMYEDLDDRWEAVEQNREKKKEKDDKEEKKRLEAEKKEQKEREKKEQEARKKFKLVGPLEVLQKGKACVDSKGNKNDLSLKEGDSVDIIRIQGNPEGKWLGRTQDGSVGYVKITSVKIDFNSLKKQAAEQNFDEVYDDIDTTPEQSQSKAGVVLPPLPGEEIYDDVDQSPNVSPSDPGQSPVKPRVLQWMHERGRRAPSIKVLPPFSKDSDPKGGIIDDEIYDDVDTQNVPAQPSMINISKADPKKQKKLEKEEKEFRKKFKYDGEIKVLNQVTIIPILTNKKWSSKELPLKAGEKLDVIVLPVDNKFICRNDEGKFGYVSTCYVVTDDGDIYDDIGEDCIYDND